MQATDSKPHISAILLGRKRPKFLADYAKRGLIEPSDRAAERRLTLRRFRGLLTMPDRLLQDIGLSRAAIIKDRLRFRSTGELPRYLR